jgi:hypothetical protein
MSRYTSVYWCTHPYTSMYTPVYVGVHTCVHRCTHLCTSVYAGVHTCTHLCTPAYTPVHWRVTLVLRQLYTSYACVTPINFCKGITPMQIERNLVGIVNFDRTKLTIKEKFLISCFTLLYFNNFQVNFCFSLRIVLHWCVQCVYVHMIMLALWIQ